MSFVDMIRNCPELEAVMHLEKAAVLIEDMTLALLQYRDDLNYPPTKDSLSRRFEMIDSLLKRV
jgi:hypothetical protein